MSDPRWQGLAPELGDDHRLVSAVIDVHEAILRESFAGDPMINTALGVHYRSFRRLGDWRLMLVLTPWMLARLLFPDRAPGLVIPPGWSAEERKQADYCVLGPAMRIDLQGAQQSVHLNFHPRLGHYLLHPLCLNMQGFVCADEVFEAWNQVIRVRDDNMKRMQRDCPLQREVSRRELFSRFRS